MKTKPLKNPRHELFAQEYAKDRNGTQAAIRAGYSPKTADRQGSRLLSNAEVAARVEHLIAEASKRNAVELDRVIKEVATIALSNVKNLVECMDGDTLLLKSKDDIPDELWPCVESIQSTKDGIRVKLYSKTTALDMLMKHLGGYEKDNQQRQPNIPEKVFLLPAFQGEEGAPADGDGSPKE